MYQGKFANKAPKDRAKSQAAGANPQDPQTAYKTAPNSQPMTKGNTVNTPRQSPAQTVRSTVGKSAQSTQQPAKKSISFDTGDLGSAPHRTEKQQNHSGAIHFDPQFDITASDFVSQTAQQFTSYSDYLPETDYAEPEYKKPRRGPRISGVIFYILLIAGIIFSYGRIQKGLRVSEQALITYEQVQPNHLAENVFNQLFEAPDWAALYDNASANDPSHYEGKEAFVRYIENKVGSNPLTFKRLYNVSDTEICYGVYLERDKVASFTMVNDSDDPSNPDWKFGSVGVYYTNEESYYIENLSNHIVKVNGVALDDSTIVKIDSVLPTKALGELKEQMNVPDICLREVNDLMTKPQVTIEDQEGNAVAVSYDEATRTFSEDLQERAVPEEARQLALDAIHAYCEFMIKETTRTNLSKFFKSNTDTFQAITGSDLMWVQREKDHNFANESVTNYIRYNDKTFSVHVELDFQLVREDDSVKESSVEKNLIFEQETNGKWRCIRMTGLDLTEEITKVRLKFVQDENVLSSRMIDSEEKTVYCPDAVTPTIVSAEENSNQDSSNSEQPVKITFAGWALKLTDKFGKPYYKLVFEPALDRKAEVPGGLLEEPVTLYPVFLKEKIK